MTELTDIINRAKEVSGLLIDNGEEHTPIIIAWTPKGLGLIHIVQMNKDRFKSNLTTILRAIDADAYVFICEAWTAEGEALAKMVLNGGVAVSELPPDDRSEILSIMAVENGKLPISYFAKIRWTQQGRKLAEWVKVDGVADGRLVLTNWRWG